MPCVLPTPKMRLKQILSLHRPEHGFLPWKDHNTKSGISMLGPWNLKLVFFENKSTAFPSQAQDRVDFNLEQLAHLTKHPDATLGRRMSCFSLSCLAVWDLTLSECSGSERLWWCVSACVHWLHVTATTTIIQLRAAIIIVIYLFIIIYHCSHSSFYISVI